MFDLPLLIGSSAAGGSSSSPQGAVVQIGMIVAVFAVFWLLIIRPQRKKQKEEQKMRSSVKKGDKITSIGGICGIVKNVGEQTIIVEVDTKGTTLEFTKSAVGRVEPRNAETSASGSASSDKPELEESSGKD